MNQAIARSNIKKYKAWCILTAILLAILSYLCIHFIGYKAALLILAVGFLLIRFLFRFLHGKYISGPIVKDLNAPLYSEIVRQGKMYPHSAQWQLQSEYYVGNYKNALKICNKMLEDPRCYKKFKYYYLFLQANMYFDVDDKDALADVCRKYQNELSNETERKRNKIQKIFAKMDFYQNYLDGNFDSCSSYLSKTQTLPLHKIIYTFGKARIALSKNETEEAAEYFREIIQKAPNLNYAELSSHGLEAIENDIPYNETFEKLEESLDFIIIRPSRAQRATRLAILISEAALFLILLVWSGFNAYRANEYTESIRVLLETKYDNVEIIEIFNLKYEGLHVDSIFVSKTDKGIIVGSLFTYSGSDKTEFDVDLTLPYSYFENSDPQRAYFEFNCTREDYYTECCVYTDKRDIPEDYSHLTKLEVEGKTIYLVIMPVTMVPTVN